jgi:glycosyltransferase involved in cell wall biosynthesis
VHVYLSYPFVLSWSLLEAMSVGAAIVASNVAPVREVIDHGEHGLLVDFFDKDPLIRSIAGLLDDAAERSRLGAQARRRAQGQYDLQSICLPQQLGWIDGLIA